MHAVDEVNIRSAGGPEYHLSTGSKAARSVRGEIVCSEIRLRFHQHAHRFAMQQNTTEQIGSQFLRRTSKKIEIYRFRSAQ